MVDTARAPATAATRRDEILEAVAFAAERLLLAADWRDAADDVLARFGIAADVSRVYLLENTVDERGRLCLTQAVEWCSPGIASQSENPALRGSPWIEAGFGRWVEILGRGDIVVGDVADLPAAERPVLETQDIRTLLAVPIAVDGDWWGCIGVDECHRNRDWASGEIKALRTAAALIGAALKRQRQDESLRRAEARYRSVVEQIPAVTYFDVVDETSVHLGFVSPQIETLLGYPCERFLTDPEWWFDLVHPEDKERVDTAARRSGNALVPFDQEYRMLAADGTWVWVHDTTAPVRDEHGTIKHFQGFLTDVTPRRSAEQARRDAESRYRNVVERIPAVTYIDEPPAEPSGSSRLTFMSPQIETLLGYPAGRFTDQPSFWFDLMHPDDLQALDASGALDPDNAAAYDAEYRMRHADGRWIWVHDSTATVLDDDGTIAYFQGFMTDATARKVAEDALTETESRYRRFLEAIPAVTYTDIPHQDGAAVVGYMSPQIDAILGRLPDDFVEDAGLWFRLIHPDDLARMREANAFDPTDPSPFDQEYRMLRADGTWAWVHDTSSVVLGADGSIEYFQGFMTDITARKLAEEQVRDAEERYRLIVEQTPAITYQELPADVYDAATSVVYVSPQVEAILGYSTEQWSDPGFWASAMHPDDLDDVMARSAETNASGEPYRQDYRMTAADGRVVWLHDESHAIRDADGTITVWQGVITDITERVEGEEKLRRAQGRLQALIDHIPAVVYVEAPGADPSRFYISPQVEEMFGYTAEEWTWTPDFWLDHVHPEDRPAAEAADRESDASRDGYSLDYRFRHADGSWVWVHDEAVYVPTGDEGFWQGFLYDITSMKEAEQQLLGAERVYRATVEHLPAVVYRELLGGESVQLYVSPQVANLIGYTPEEWYAGAPSFWSDHLHPDDRDEILAANERADEAKEQFARDYRMRRKDGTYVWVHDEAVYVLGDGPDEGWWQGFLIDISSRKEAEGRLVEAERVYRATVEQLPAVVYREPPRPETRPDDMYISPRVEDLLGYTPDEWRAGLPTFWAEHLHPEDHDRVIEANTEANRTKEPFIADYRMRRRDGAYVWIHDEATFVRDETTDDEGWWQGFLLDITGRVDAEQHVREAEEKFRTIVEQNPAVIYTQEFDADGATSRTTYISPRQPEVFGYTADEVMRDPTLWARTIHPEDRDAVLGADAASNEEQPDSFSMEYRMIAKDGRIVWVQDQAVLVRVEGRPSFWQGFLLDITERKHAEEQLEHALEVEREASRSLRALDEMKNTFLQAVSHDLRTPLAAILGLAITLERGDVQLDEADAKDLARRIATNARRLDRLVTNLLDLDRLSRGIVTPKLVAIDVGSLVRRVVAESELVPDSRLRIDVAAHVQRVDAAKVERIVENLLANAVRHTAEDATIWIALVPADDGFELRVEDDGPGVAPELREQVFEPFLQGPDAPQHAPGVGVGLTLVRRFAELHGGRAWVDERDGGGASFRVSLPATPPAGD